MDQGYKIIKHQIMKCQKQGCFYMCQSLQNSDTEAKQLHNTTVIKKEKGNKRELSLFFREKTDCNEPHLLFFFSISPNPISSNFSITSHDWLIKQTQGFSDYLVTTPCKLKRKGNFYA